MRIIGWSSDVCSSDLARAAADDRAMMTFGKVELDRYASSHDDCARFTGQASFKEDPARKIWCGGEEGKPEEDRWSWGNLQEVDKIGRASGRERVCQYV